MLSADDLDYRWGTQSNKERFFLCEAFNATFVLRLGFMVNVEKFTIAPVVMEKNGQELLKHLHMLYLFGGSSPFFCLI